MNDAYIMLVEDREDDIELTLRSFKRAQITSDIVVKRDGVEALEFIVGLMGSCGEATGKPPDLILLDVSMPRMNGIEFLEKLRALDHTRYVPVVMHTTSSEERDLVASYDRGANSYLRKPTSPAESASIASLIGRYWIGANKIAGSRPSCT